MGNILQVIKKRRLSSKLLAAIGIVLVIAGGVAFLNSLGSGGGYLAAVSIICGALLIVASIVNIIIKAARGG
jgi:uncharacterized membrane protein